MKSIKNNQSGFGHVGILIVIVVLAVMSFTALRVIGANDDNSNSQASISNQEDQPTLDELPSDLSTIKPLAEIQELAKADAADSNVLGIGLEVEDGRTVYVVHLTSGQVLVYDAITGEVVQLEDDNNGEIEDGEAIPVNFIAGISIQQAIDIAKQNRPDSKLNKVELEVEDGIVVYSVRFTDDSRVDVNAADGTIQRLKDEAGTDIIKVDDDSDDDGVDNSVDSDDDNDGIDDEDDQDDDSDGIEDEVDDEDDESDNSGGGSSNSEDIRN